ncbi:MAG: TatD family hydrolase, partial [Gemmatimonadota bacterium]|nr:TatD family hydrolase [Gemmatimonadota bacterium]
MLIDSHCHLTDRAFQADLGDVLTRSRAAGVGGWVCISSSVDDAREALALTQSHAGLYATVGVHPHEAAEAPPDSVDRIRDAVADPRCVAIGETGLDHYYDHSPRDVQQRLFTDHLALASELELPVVVHSREADAEMSAILREYGPSVTGVLHCFGGPPEMLELALDIGWLVSFTGSCTYKRFDRTLVEAVPRDRYMLE